MKRPLAVFGFTLLAVTFVLCIFSDVSLAILTALISYILFMVSAYSSLLIFASHGASHNFI